MKTRANFEELPAEKLRWRCPLEIIPYGSSDECKGCDEIIGQERALKSIQTGLEIQSLGYNIFVTGLVGTGRTTTIKQLLEKLEKGEKTPDDLLYVNNFKYPDEPTLITLPAGQGRKFNEVMANVIAILQKNIPDLFKSKHYTEKRDGLIEVQQQKGKEILKDFEEKAAQEGFSVIQVQMGFFSRPDLIPLINDVPTPFNKIEALVKESKFSKKTLDSLKKNYEKLTGELEDIFERLKEIDEETQTLLKKWVEESITPLI